MTPWSASATGAEEHGIGRHRYVGDCRIMDVKKPIIIVGVGRSGSTAFQEAFRFHPQVVWLSRLCSSYPRRPQLNRLLMEALDVPVIGSYLQREIEPGEVYRFWEYYAHGFRTPFRDLVASDVTVTTKKRVRKVLSRMTTRKRDRLLIKITGWSRIGFLHEIFPDAKFVHILRDGRAVANSMINVDWWGGWEGPQNWRYGDLTPEQYAEWERYDRSFVALAGIQWKILMDAMDRAKAQLDSNSFCEVRYEDLCADPVGVYKDVVGFCDLPWSQEFEKTIRRQRWSSTNDKWKQEFTPDQQQVLNCVLKDHLARYGYAI